MLVCIFIVISSELHTVISSELHTVISSERSESRNLNHANITNIPDLIHENAPFCGQKAHFDVRVHENRHFHGRQAHFSVPIHENAPYCG